MTTFRDYQARLSSSLNVTQRTKPEATASGFVTGFIIMFASS